MTEEQKERVRRFRAHGYGYGKISKLTNISENTIKSFCRREGIAGYAASSSAPPVCPNCGIVVPQKHGRKRKKFCCDACRNQWWNSHLYLVNRKANYDYVCKYCNKPFTAYGDSNRRYCSHACYIADRFGGNRHGQ